MPDPTALLSPPECKVPKPPAPPDRVPPSASDLGAALVLAGRTVLVEVEVEVELAALAAYGDPRPCE
jgi:hypothetical protein